MLFESRFDNLPNELYLLIFDYLNPIDLIYSFLNLNKRLNNLLKSYSNFSLNNIDLTKLNPNVFQYYCLNNKLINEIKSLKLTDEQYKLIQFSTNNKLSQLNLYLKNELHFNSNQLFLFKYLNKLIIQKSSITWEKPFIICQYLKQINIHLKNHFDLIDLLNNLPIIEIIHIIIDYDVNNSNCQDNNSLILNNISKRLIDFSYIINSKYGLVYFVTDYKLIESLIQKLNNLINLNLYIIGCNNLIIDSDRLENNLFNYLPKLKEFNLFIQSYGGKQLKTMNDFIYFKWNFGSYYNQLTDMYFLFTLPFHFNTLDEIINQYFINGIITNFTKSLNENEFDKQIGLNNIKHINISCSITDNLLILIRDKLKSLKSIYFSSSIAEYINPPSLSRQSKYFIYSINRIIFDYTCKYQSPFIRLLPNLIKLIINQTLLNTLINETGDGYLYNIKELHVYSFQRHFLNDIINSFTNLNKLILKTLLTNNEGPIRSFLDGRCIHKHRPVSITDILIDLLKSKLFKLKHIQVGCYFERDQQNIESIISRIIKKYRGDNYQFNINCEDFKSTGCGQVNILFF